MYGPEDYNTASLPPSCCSSKTSQCVIVQASHDGCAHKLADELQNKGQLVGGIAIGIGAIEVSHSNVCIRNQYFTAVITYLSCSLDKFCMLKV